MTRLFIRVRGIEQVPGGEGTSESVLECTEWYQKLCEKLDDPLLERIFLLKLAGCDHSEIARELGCVRRTVQRKLRVIRELWEAGDGCRRQAVDAIGD
jgi:DNA-directed RNA polymerase specialized sigma24 family protein